MPDLVGQRFSPGSPDVAWCGDITYIPTDKGWHYLAGVLDLGSRRLLGWITADTMSTALVASALTIAIERRGGDVAGIAFNVDSGSQYLSDRFRAPCDHHGIRQSVGRVALCFENSAAKSFWSNLKRELVHRYWAPTRDDAKAAITVWIKRYNTVRGHSSLGYVPPVEWELHYRLIELQAA